MSIALLFMRIYTMFCEPTFFEESLEGAQQLKANEEVNENDDVSDIDEEHLEMNAFQEELKYIHICCAKKNSVCT